MIAHQDHVTSVPPQATVLGSTRRSPIEIWGIDNNILCMAALPAFNITFVLELLINKLYD